MSADFIDSNVLVYLFDDKEASKRECAEDLVERALRDRSGVISYQVVQETLNVITRKLAVPVSMPDARAFLERVLVPIWRVMPSSGLYTRALDLVSRYEYSFYDSLIIAAAIEAGCERLYSEDFQDGQPIDTVTIENPFAV